MNQINEKEIKNINDNSITLTDEYGTDKEFEFLDIVEYEGNEYLVMCPIENSDGEVTILKIERCNDNTEVYVSIEIEEEIEAAFKVFKNKWKSEYNFKD